MIEHATRRLNVPREAGLIVGLFLAFRLMMLITLRPEHITFFGDYPYYYELAKLSDRGLWPYLHYWMEYPPIFPFLSTLLYRLTAGGGYDAYVLALGIVQTAFGAGCLIVLMRLATRLHGETVALRLGWVYSLLFVPMVFTWWQFEAITALCILFALDRLLDGRDASSAVATGVGVMVKLVPLLILSSVALSRPLRKTLAYAAIIVLVIVLVVAPLLVAAPDTTRASLASPLAWSSWETVWALLDGNFRTGLLGGIDIHFDNALATTPVGNPAQVPDWLKAFGFGLAYLAALWWIRPVSRGSPYKIVGVMTITYVFFVLWSKGWSPQWQMILVPLILLMMPAGRGAGFVLIFGLVNLAEWPVLISRGLWDVVPLMIVLRTLLLLALLVEVVRRCQRAGGASASGRRLENQ